MTTFVARALRLDHSVWTAPEAPTERALATAHHNHGRPPWHRRRHLRATLPLRTRCLDDFVSARAATEATARQGLATTNARIANHHHLGRRAGAASTAAIFVALLQGLRIDFCRSLADLTARLEERHVDGGTSGRGAIVSHRGASEQEQTQRKAAQPRHGANTGSGKR